MQESIGIIDSLGDSRGRYFLKAGRHQSQEGTSDDDNQRNHHYRPTDSPSRS